MVRNNVYHLDLKEISLKNGNAGTQFLSLAFENHDDLFQIFEMIQSKQIFNNKETATEFALGLKLFTEVMLKNKDNPLFDELRPAILDFMKKLKSQ
jgi:uncharacterized protein YfkK (UPF0435 family)